MKIIFTDHAKDAMRSKKILVQEVVATIKTGQKWFSKTDGRYHARKSGIEVVFENKRNFVIVITCFYE